MVINEFYLKSSGKGYGLLLSEDSKVLCILNSYCSVIFSFYWNKYFICLVSSFFCIYSITVENLDEKNISSFPLSLKSSLIFERNYISLIVDSQSIYCRNSDICHSFELLGDLSSKIIRSDNSFFRFYNHQLSNISKSVCGIFFKGNLNLTNIEVISN